LGGHLKTIAIVQARMGSTRLPGKVMHSIHGVPMIELILSRLAQAKRIDTMIVATSKNPENKPLIDHIRKLGIDVFEGSENDVLKRYHQAAKSYQPDAVVRITGDCPLVDPQLVDSLIASFTSQKVDYLTNTNPPSYPDGLDIEVCTFKALGKAAREATTIDQREHVTPYIYESGLFKTANIANQDDLSRERWTVDEPDDLKVVEAIFKHFQPCTGFS